MSKQTILLSATAAALLSACITPGYVARPGPPTVLASEEPVYEWRESGRSMEGPSFQCYEVSRVQLEREIHMVPEAYDRQENGLMIALGVLQAAGGITLVALNTDSPEMGIGIGVTGLAQAIGFGVHRGSSMSQVRMLEPYTQSAVVYWDDQESAVDPSLCE